MKTFEDPKKPDNEIRKAKKRMNRISIDKKDKRSFFVVITMLSKKKNDNRTNTFTTSLKTSKYSL